MKIKKIKLWKILGTLTGALAVISVPIITTSCSNTTSNGGTNNGGINNSEIKTPTITDNFSIKADLGTIIASNGGKTEIQNQLQNIANQNKASFITNYDELQKNGQDVSITITNNEGNDNVWGQQEYVDWSWNLKQGNIKEWNGLDSTASTITVKSIADLKTYLTTNLAKIMETLETQGEEKQATYALADVELKIDSNHNLLVGVEKTTSAKEGNETVEKFVLKIPQKFINLKFTVSASVSYGNDKNVTKDVPVDFNVLDTINSQAFNSYDEIVFEQLSNSGDKINVHGKITDQQILDKLGWVNIELKNHIDGGLISIENLNERAIKKALSINGDKQINSIKIDMPYREPSKKSYNGTFNIYVNFTENKNGTLEYTTTKYGKDQWAPLQLYVQDAYVIKTIDESKQGQDRFMMLNNFKDNKKMGFGISKYETVGGIWLGLKLPNTWRVFNNLLVETIDSSKTPLAYGVQFSYKLFNWHQLTGNLFTLNVQLRQGFKFKQTFDLQDKHYNVYDQMNEVKFKMSVDKKDSGATIEQLCCYSKEDLEQYYATHNAYNGTDFTKTCELCKKTDFYN